MKLKYIGVQPGKFVYKQFEQVVNVGEEYIVPKEHVSELLKTGLWEEVIQKTQLPSEKNKLEDKE